MNTEFMRTRPYRWRYPFMGNAHIKGRRPSVSAVGRVVERRPPAGAIRPASFCEGRAELRCRRDFANWAKRWKYGAEARKEGNWCRSIT